MRIPRRRKRPKDHGRSELVVTIKMNRHGIQGSVKSGRAGHELCGWGSRPCKGRFHGRFRSRLIDEGCAYVAKALKAGGNPYWDLLRGRKPRRIRK